MEECMSFNRGDAVEDSVEVTEGAGESSGHLGPGEVETEVDESGATEVTTSPSESALSDLRALKGILEALLFVTADPIPVTRFLALLGAVSKHEVEQALASLGHDYEQEGRGLQLAEVAGGYRIMTKAEFAPWLKRLEKVKAPSKLSRSALESLAIIAYKQPIVRAEVEQIRGVETSGVIRTLLERKLVRIVGRKEEPGRPIMYGTTKFFLEHFGLRDLSQLPPLRDFRELGESEQAMLPMDESVEVAVGSLSQPLAASTDEQTERNGQVSLMDEITLIEVNDASTQMGEIDANVEDDFVAADVVEES